MCTILVYPTCGSLQIVQTSQLLCCVDTSKSPYVGNSCQIDILNRAYLSAVEDVKVCQSFCAWNPDATLKS